MAKLIFATAAAALALSACQSERDATEDQALEAQTDSVVETVPEQPADAAGTEDGIAAVEIAAVDAETPPQTSASARPAAAPAAPTSSPPPARTTPTPAAVSASSGNAVAGGQVYAATCVVCHGPNGTGAIPGVPNFTIANGRLAKSDAALLRNMTNGFQSPGSPMAMPAKGGNASLSDQDMKNVLAYMRKAFGR